MSASALPIAPARFASALNDLPISSLYAKHAELKNNIVHMESSNKQLEDFARDNDDRDCYEALLENRQVIKRFLERIDMIKKEVVEVRGLPWRPQGEEENDEKGVVVNGASVIGENGQQESRNGTRAQGGDEEEEGVFL
jgi:hypothetical protein